MIKYQLLKFTKPNFKISRLLIKRLTDKNKTNLKERIGNLAYNVTQEKGTEPPFTGEYYNFKEKGKYHCVVCDADLFESEYKFESGTGWPSFYKAEDKNISTNTDTSHQMVRTEIQCKNCGSHLGHLFDDGPYKKRYCVNSCSLDFRK